MTPMHVDVIADDAGLARVEARWNSLYAVDPQAQVFVSWSWLRHWFQITPYKWFVLAVRADADGDYVAFLPLARVEVSRYGLGLQHLLYMGGKPISDYAGFVADPAHEDSALAALGRYLIQQATWNWFHVGHVVDERLDRFLDAIQGESVRIIADEVVRCPFVELPSDWESYLTARLSHKGRFNLRRYMRLIEELPDFHATVTTPQTAEADIAALLDLWQRRWGTIAPPNLDNYTRMLRGALEDGMLWLRVLRAGETVIAGAAGLLDPVRKQFCYYIGGFNPEFAKLSPGKVVVGYAIRDAIAQGCARFDFLLGGEEYKLDFFGASERLARGATIMRMDVSSRVRRRLAHWLAPAPAVAR